jgi:hypothetical protein
MVPSGLRSLTTSRGPRRTARTGMGSASRRRALTGVAMVLQLRTVFGARFSRKALSRAFASSSPWAIAEISASVT